MTPTVRVMRNPRDGAGYIDNQLVTPTAEAQIHYHVGARIEQHRYTAEYRYSEPELVPWDDCPVGVLVPHEDVCESCRQQVTS